MSSETIRRNFGTKTCPVQAQAELNMPSTRLQAKFWNVEMGIASNSISRAIFERPSTCPVHQDNKLQYKVQILEQPKLS